MADWTEADIEQNRKLNELAHKLAAIDAKLDAVHEKFKPIETIIDLVEKIWSKVIRL